MQEHQLKTCNCRKANQCPLNGKCLTKSAIYNASVTTRDGNEEAKTYIGLTKNEFNPRSLEGGIKLTPPPLIFWL